jgi:hypothetical protein
MRNILSRSTAVLGIATLTLGIAAAPAWAARGDGCPVGACGSATWTWNGKDEARNISMNVKDTKCDGHPAYIQFYVFPGVWETQKRTAGEGCGKSQTWSGLKVHDAGGISGLQVRVCVNDAGADTCKTQFVKNPNY